MSLKTKRLLAVATAAVSLAVAAPARAAVDAAQSGSTAAKTGRLMAACQAKSLGTHSEFGQFVAVAGTYKGPADVVEVQLTCGIVRWGVTIDRVQDPLPGPVAALAAVRTVGRGTVSSCYEIKVIPAAGSPTYYDTCP
jgi:hypothetical protein